MNDRFKFRAWNPERNDFIYNIQDVGSDFSIRCWEDCFGDFLFNEDYIIEQCTGLKDKNGKLIYEGDIIEDEYGCKYIVKFGKHTITIPVGYENGETECWGMYLSKFTYSFIYLQEQCDNLNPDNEYLIIGNIHENPELLED